MKLSLSSTALLRAMAWVGVATLSSVVAAELIEPAASTRDSASASFTPSRFSRIYPNIPSQPLELYVHASSDVVHGRIVSSSAVIVDGKLPHMAYELKVYSSLKGRSGESLTVRVGGALGADRGAWVDGAPEFQVGEEVVLFTWTDDMAITGILGLEHGTFRVEERVGAHAFVHGDGLDAGTTLPDFFGRVEDILAAQAMGEER